MLLGTCASWCQSRGARSLLCPQSNHLALNWLPESSRIYICTCAWKPYCGNDRRIHAFPTSAYALNTFQSILFAIVQALTSLPLIKGLQRTQRITTWTSYFHSNSWKSSSLSNIGTILSQKKIVKISSSFFGSRLDFQGKQSWADCRKCSQDVHKLVDMVFATDHLVFFLCTEWYLIVLYYKCSKLMLNWLLISFTGWRLCYGLIYHLGVRLLRNPKL